MPEFIWPPGMPDEIKAQYAAMADRSEMQTTSVRQLISRFYQELTFDQLEALITILNVCINVEPATAYYEGFTRAVQACRFDKWPGWGDDKPEVPEPVEVSLVNVLTGEQLDKDQTSGLMDEYNLSNQNGHIFCTGCGMEYVSLADRMLREPGPNGCSGCTNKAKWG